jgi:hypothetical protein
VGAFQRAVRQGERERQDKDEDKRIEKLARELPEREWTRARSIDALRRELERDLAANPTFQALLLGSEAEKLKALYRSFVKLAAASARVVSYAARVDPADLTRKAEGQRALAARTADPELKGIAERNAEILEKRLANLKEADAFLARAAGQMNLIENSVRLMHDQALTMTDPDQLTGPLDELLASVEAAQQSGRDAESLLSGPVEAISDELPEAARVATRVR